MINNKGVRVLGQLFTMFDMNYLLLYIIVYSNVKILREKLGVFEALKPL